MAKGRNRTVGKRGPLPAAWPDNVRAIKGEATHSRPPAAPKARPEKPDMPRGLDSRAKTAWRLAVEELDKLGLLAKCDRDVLAAFCQQVSIMNRAWVEAKSAKFVIEGDRGPVRNPIHMIHRQAAQSVNALSHQLGLTPQSRLRMPSPPPDEDDSDLD